MPLLCASIPLRAFLSVILDSFRALTPYGFSLPQGTGFCGHLGLKV